MNHKTPTYGELYLEVFPLEYVMELEDEIFPPLTQEEKRERAQVMNSILRKENPHE